MNNVILRIHFLLSFVEIFSYFGIIIAATIYANTPEPPNAENNTHAKRTNVGSILKYSAIPPQTPANI